MKTRTCVASLVFALTGITSIAWPEPSLPSPFELFDTYESHWTNRRFEELDLYLEALEAQHAGYVPLLIARYVNDYYNGAQSERLIEKVSRLIDWFEEHPEFGRPSHVEQLQAIVAEHQRLLQVYAERGWSEHDRLDRFALDKIYTGEGVPLTFELAVVLAPPIIISEPGSSTTDHSTRAFVTPDLGTVDLEELTAIASAPPLRSIEESWTAVRTITKVHSDRAPDVLSDLLKEINIVKDIAAEHLALFSQRGIDEAIAVLKEGSPTSARKAAIYCLIRIGIYTPEVHDALDSTRDKYFLLADYSTVAIEYLKHKSSSNE